MIQFRCLRFCHFFDIKVYSHLNTFIKVFNILLIFSIFIVAKYKQDGKLSSTFEVYCVPFVERFESTTAGASAQIRFEVKRPLTTCDGQFQ